MLLVSCSPEEPTEPAVVTYKYEIGYLQPVHYQSIVPSIDLSSDVINYYPRQDFRFVNDVDGSIVSDAHKNYVGTGNGVSVVTGLSTVSGVSIVSGELNSNEGNYRFILNNIPTLGSVGSVVTPVESIFYIKITDLSGNIIKYQEIACGLVAYASWRLVYNVNTNILTNNPL